MKYDDSIIFKYIDLDSNDMFSKMNGDDLQSFIILLEDFYLKLRDNIGLDDSITFGVELEFENANREKIKDLLFQNLPKHDWILKSDLSLFNGAEINSPVLTDKKIFWNELNEVCSIVKKYATIGKNAGGHIHVGTQTLGSERQSWLNFIKLWSVYENIIYRFAYGDYLTYRPSLVKYASPVKNQLWNNYIFFINDNVSLSDMLIDLSLNRRQGVNFSNVFKDNLDNYEKLNTIEFRCPNATFNSEVWQNNVSFFSRLLSYSRSSSFDDDIIQRRQGKYSQWLTNLDCYNDIYFDQALELCDMIFDNNLDKICFLKQYFKSCELYNLKNNKIKARSLVKK